MILKHFKKFIVAFLFVGSFFIFNLAYADRTISNSGSVDVSGGGNQTLWNIPTAGSNEYFSRWESTFSVQQISIGNSPTGQVSTGLCGINYVHNDFDYPFIFGPQPAVVTSPDCQNNADLFLFVDPGNADVSIDWNATAYLTCMPGYSGNPCVLSPPPGTIQVQSQLATTVDITGPLNFSVSLAAGYAASTTSAPAGTYNIVNIAAPPCYSPTVRPPGTTQTLIAGEVIFFIIDYTYICAPPPTGDIKANGSDGPISIPYNNPVTLSWTSTDADIGSGCSVTSSPSIGSWSGPSNPGVGTINLTATSYTFTVNCSGTGGSSTPDSVVVNVLALPTANLTCNL